MIVLKRMSHPKNHGRGYVRLFEGAIFFSDDTPLSGGSNTQGMLDACCCVQLGGAGGKVDTTSTSLREVATIIQHIIDINMSGGVCILVSS